MQLPEALEALPGQTSTGKRCVDDMPMLASFAEWQKRPDG